MPPKFEKPDRVYYFGTCLMDTIFPDAGLAGIKLIQRQGVQVIFPRKQSCCGQPAYNSGFPKEAKKVALKQVRLFTEDYPIVVPSGSCAGMMKHHYPLLFEGDRHLQQVQAFSKRIVELSEFLVRTLDIQLADIGQPIKVTWHSSCHALREMHIIEYSKSLIRRLKNVELIELQNEHECCGFGGTFAVKQPKISGAMVVDKVADIRQTGAERLLAGDCGCLLNISGAMDYQKVPIRSQHLAEFIWERTHGE
ncbi:MAG: (Fe-S)-binding protein [Desulfobacterales bacterium]|nr:(Fe-S)-binding protein [Desulfobacterales bacterium]